MGRYTGDMDKDLKCLIPEAVADCYTQDPAIADQLVAKAKRIYRLNKDWGRTITDTDKGRDTLHTFMAHWMDAYNKTGEML